MLPRNIQIDPSIQGIYHCFSRCVRRAFLCGFDRLTNKSYEHRKAWIRKRLQHLASIFAMDVAAFAIMSNHIHVVLRTAPDRAQSWTPREIANRWLRLFPPADETLRESALDTLAKDDLRIELLRSRLGDLSWFMRCLKERIARSANREDDCHGRFWEGRFHCQTLLDEAAVLACCVYVDLNEVRTGKVKRPEDSLFTSLRQRISELSGQVEGGQGTKIVKGLKASLEQGSWLAPLDDGSWVNGLTLRQYVELVDWTGRQLVDGKRGVIPAHLAPILQRLGIEADKWQDGMTSRWSRMGTAMGSAVSLASEAMRRGVKWVVGICDVYGPSPRAGPQVG